uniref:Importin N-terminal domain-containing protein n=1 Tax=Oryza rufipogon TaxID=4529 RepID=A0A0E0PWB1_ORYRU
MAAGAGDGDQRWLVECLTATLDTARDVRAFAEESLRQASLLPGLILQTAPIELLALLYGLLASQSQPVPSACCDAALAYVTTAAAALSRRRCGRREGVSGGLTRPVDATAPFVASASCCCRHPVHQQHLRLQQPCPINTAPASMPSMSPSSNQQQSGDIIPSTIFMLENFSCQKIVIIRQLLLTSLDDSHGKIRTAIGMAVAAIGQQDWPEDWPELLPYLLKLISDQSNGCGVRGALRCLALLSDDLDDTCIPKLVPELFPSLYSIISSPHRETVSLISSMLDPLMEQFSAILNSPVQSHNPDDWNMQMETFVSSFKVYQLSMIQASEDVDSVGYDSDGSERSLESFGIQLQNWSRDANQYVADEDDVTYSCRVSGSLLLEEIVTAYDEYGIESVLEASQMRFHESRELKKAGSTDWWRLHEASFFALGSLSEQLCEAQDSGYNVRDLLEQMVTDTVGTEVHQYPFLHARAFSILSKPPPVKVGACRALAQLLPESNQSLNVPNIMGILSSLVDLLGKASDETLHLVLETLQSTIKSCGEQSTLIEPVISPIILDVWAQHIADPFISIDAVEVLEAIKNAPGCLEPLVSRILPTIGSILEKPKIQQNGLAAGSLDLLTMILKNAPTTVVKAIFDTCFTSIIQIVLESDDHGEMQNATECLAAFISGGRQELLLWGGGQGRTLKMLLDAASRLLDPVLESSVSLFVGSYILQLIIHLPSHLSPHFPELIAAIVRRMQSSSITGLKSSLVVIVARLGYNNSLAYIMSEWSQLQSEIQGAYQIKVTTTALALLISTRHPELSRIEVQGHIIKTSAGITTRSKARVAPDHWTKIPLPAKIFSLLADTLAEIQEQVVGDEDDCEEDSDWEEIQNGDSSIPHDMIYSASVPSNAKPSVEHLNAMAKVFDEDDDGSYDDDLAKADSLNEVKLSDFLTNIFVKLWESDRLLFEYLCQALTDSQRTAVDKVLRK